MVEAQNKVVSIEAFRAASRAAMKTDRTIETLRPVPAAARAIPSARAIEHRERMLRFLKMEAIDRATQGRLLL